MSHLIWTCTVFKFNFFHFFGTSGIDIQKCKLENFSVHAFACSSHLCLLLFQNGIGRTLGQVLSLAFDPNGKFLWAGDDKGSLYSFTVDVTNGKLVKTRK